MACCWLGAGPVGGDHGESSACLAGVGLRRVVAGLVTLPAVELSQLLLLLLLLMLQGTRVVVVALACRSLLRVTLECHAVRSLPTNRVAGRQQWCQGSERGKCVQPLYLVCWHVASASHAVLVLLKATHYGALCNAAVV